MMRTPISRALSLNLPRSTYRSLPVQAPILQRHIPSTARKFSMLHPLHYDGVYKELKSMKHQKPWLQALREREEAAAAAGTAGPVEDKPAPIISPKKVQPKKMKESYFEIVSSRLPQLGRLGRRRRDIYYGRRLIIAARRVCLLG